MCACQYVCKPESGLGDAGALFSRPPTIRSPDLSCRDDRDGNDKDRFNLGDGNDGDDDGHDAVCVGILVSVMVSSRE